MSSVVWKEVLGSLEGKVGRPNYITWLKPSQLLETAGSLARVSVPNPYAKNWIEDNVLAEVIAGLQKHFPEIESVEIVVRPTESPSFDGLPLLQERDEAASDPVQDPAQKERDREPPQFSDRYTFSNFIIGNNNRLAFAAAQAVAEKPGTTYNPLFLYGGVGLGKTHLMHAIGNEILSHSPKKKIIYTSCEVFTGDFINALQSKSINDFKRKYRTVDVLLIDDIQFLANKEGTQEEFFHTFNILHQANRQIVITADRVPKEMTDLEDRLISRFGWGMIADIQVPNFETRVAILQAKAEEKELPVPGDVLEFIANSITSNVRELEGALIKLGSIARLENVEITQELANRALKDLVQINNTALTTKKVIRTVADYFNVEISEILGKKRLKELVYPRQIVMYLLREKLNESYPQIGEELGGKDHTTVMHSHHKIAAEQKTNPNVENDLRAITQLLYVS